ncbi:MAG: MFS transporter [Armatimonadetes bacterium]|nr:MFS transporter [Armatimonadota bacterium]
MFDAFRYRNYRLYWTGIVLSAIGSWVQNTAQGWLVYDLTHSSLMLGTVGFLGALPVTLLTLLAGVLADRVDRRRLLFLTQTVLMASAFMMGLLTSYGVIAVWHVMVLATMSGFASAFDMPVRQSVVPTLVGKRHIMNAIALNSTAFNSARIVGPALAGILVPAIGLGKCFYFNSASYLAMIAAVALIRIESFRKPDDEQGIWADFRGGLSYVRHNKTVRTLVCLAAVPSLFAMPYAMLMPVFAEDILGVGIRGLGLLMSSVGVGGLTAALTLAMLSKSERKGLILTTATLLLPVMLVLFANSRHFALSQVFLVGLGFSNLMYLASTNSLIQTVVPDELRGRVVSAYMFAFVGMGPIGQLMMGAVAQAVGAPAALTAGGIVCAASAAGVLLFQPGIRRLT